MLLYVALFSVLISILLGRDVFKREKYLTITWLFLVASLLFSIANLMCPFLWPSNHPTFHAYTLVEFVLLGLLYQELLKSLLLKKVVRIAMILFLVYKVIDIIWITTLSRPDYASVNVEGAIILMLALLYLRQLLQQKAVYRITTHPAFWINNANLFYFAGILVFSISYLYGDGKDILWSHFFTHNYLLLLRNALLALAFWFAYQQCLPYQTKPSDE